MAMHSFVLNTKGIDHIFQQTVSALRAGQEQIFDIAEAARIEYEHLKEQSRALGEEVRTCIKRVDDLEREFNASKRRLAKVDWDFNGHNEARIKQVYDEAQALQVELVIAKEREMSLRQKRDELDRSIRRLGEVVEKAERMVKQVGVAMQVLAGDLENAFMEIEELRSKSVLATKIIQAQEEERRRVARDIHDGPAQSMASLALRAGICEKLMEGDPRDLAQELAELKMAAREILTDIRRIIFNLRPMALDDLGLAPALRRYIESLRDKSKAHIELVILGREQRLAETEEVTAFRIIQEAVNNALAHANAQQILVRVEFANYKINIIVQDDGSGFDVGDAGSRAKYVQHFGLLSMEERVSLLGGTLKIDSMPGEGTAITASIPLSSN